MESLEGSEEVHGVFGRSDDVRGVCGICCPTKWDKFLNAVFKVQVQVNDLMPIICYPTKWDDFLNGVFKVQTSSSLMTCAGRLIPTCWRGSPYLELSSRHAHLASGNMQKICPVRQLNVHMQKICH